MSCFETLVRIILHLGWGALGGAVGATLYVVIGEIRSRR
jgi:hypothetical protein